MNQEVLQNARRVSFDKMAGHWILARLGKKVLRPGGRILTEWMLDNLNITSNDDVLEFAPGALATANITFSKNPKSYIGIDADQDVIESLNKKHKTDSREFIHSLAQDIKLDEGIVDVAYSEAILTMQAIRTKEKIVQEAFRVLRPGGRYGIHELCINTENEEKTKEVKLELSKTIRVNAAPLTKDEWSEIITKAGFEVEEIRIRPMSLLKVERMIEDEGILRFLKIVFNLITHPTAKKRVVEMRKVFNKYQNEMSAISIIAKKK